MAREIVDFPIKNGDVPWQNVSLPEGRSLGSQRPKMLKTHGPWDVTVSSHRVASGPS